DVPNASIMLIIDPDRFGLSQLHQLRGRIGRGARKSYCILVSDKEKERLELFAKTISGFDVAERDLELRGPGEFLGTKQSGVPRFRFGNIVRDHALMEKARDVAIEVVDRGVAEAEALARGLVGVAVAAAERDWVCIWRKECLFRVCDESRRRAAAISGVEAARAAAVVRGAPGRAAA